MSWDVLLMKFGQPYESVAEIPDDATPLPLGSNGEIRSSVSRFFPGTDWSDEAWGIFNSPIGSIEFNLGKDVPATSMMLHVRASNEIVPPIVAMCQERNWSALDCSDGELLNHSNNPAAGLEAWREYLGQVLEQELPESEE